MPVIPVLTAVQWVGILLTRCSAIIVNLFAGLLFLLSALGYLMGAATGRETIRMLVTGFMVFAISHIARWLMIGVAAVRNRLYEFIKS